MSISILNPVSFNAIQLESITGLTVLGVDAYKPPKRDVNINPLAQSDKSKVTSAFYVEKFITVRVGISRATRALLESSIDDLNSILEPLEKDLILRQSGGLRRYTATLMDNPMNNDGGSYCEIKLVFGLSDMFGYNIGQTLIVGATGSTSKIRTDSHTFLGSAAWQVPYIEVTYTALTAPTTSEVRLRNDATGQELVISRGWSNGDFLLVDCKVGAVYVNGVEVDFEGGFPLFAKGLGYLKYSDTHSTRTYNYRAYYYPRWK